MSSQILTGIQKADNEVATILEGKKRIFFLSSTKDVYFVLFCFCFHFFVFLGGRGVDDEAPITATH